MDKPTRILLIQPNCFYRVTLMHTKKSPVKTTGFPVRPYLTLFPGYFKQIF